LCSPRRASATRNITSVFSRNNRSGRGGGDIKTLVGTGADLKLRGCYYSRLIHQL
jgi:hypothetical protein